MTEPRGSHRGMDPVGSRRVRDPGELAEFFSDDRRVHIYVLADLEEPHWAAGTWWRRGEAVVGLVELSPDDSVLAAVATRDPQGTLELLGDLAAQLHPGLLITAPIGAVDLLARHWSFAWHRTYQRFHLSDPGRLPDIAGHDMVPLGPDDIDELVEFYALDPGAAFFLPHMVTDRSFVGVRRDDDLIAVAGTHVLSEEYSVAGIGAVMTHPDWRGRGLGAVVTAGVCRRLEGRIDVIGLNCADRNIAARRTYERIGFESLLRYEEAELLSRR